MLITELHRPGIYRRKIRLFSKIGEIRADMEDDSHRFGLVVKHDGFRVVAIEGIPMRTPWTLCSGAKERLQDLTGRNLADYPIAASGNQDAKQQCTHMFDLAILAIAHAARPLGSREYEIEAPWYAMNEPRYITLLRDGHVIAKWTLLGNKLLVPVTLDEIGVKSLLTWASENTKNADELEAIFIMRRSVLISGSRIMDLDNIPNPEATGHGIGACYVHQPSRISIAKRNRGSTLDFTENPESLLSDFH